MKQPDIKLGDVVRFNRKLTDEQISKLIRFNKNYDIPECEEFIRSALSNKGLCMRVLSVSKTQKTSTEYAVFRLKNVDFRVQTRYLVLLVREPQHPLTSIFAKK